MVHYKKTNVAVKQHEGELTGAVIADNAGDFVGKRPKAEDVGNAMVVAVIDEIEAGSMSETLSYSMGLMRPGMMGSGMGTGVPMRRDFRVVL